MSYIDYYPCDICGEKTFYSADIDFAYWSNRIGKIIVICPECLKCSDINIVKKTSPNRLEAEIASLLHGVKEAFPFESHSVLLSKLIKSLEQLSAV